MSKKKSFIKGAAILGGAGIVIKVLGAIFRIPLGNILGDEGMSYYQTAYPMYLWLITIATAGLPTAIAKMISERRAIQDYHNIRKIFKTAFYLMTFLGFISFLVLFFGAEFLVKLVKNDPESVLALKALAPALIFVPMMSVFRGFFQGLQDLKPYAISQIVEQFFRVVLGLGLVIVLIDYSVGYASAGATFGAAIGGLGGLIFMVLYYLRSRDNIFDGESFIDVEVDSTKTVINNLLKIAIPITLGAAVIPTMNIIDLTIVMRRLHSIGIVEQANDLYGQLTGYANALINLPAVINVAFQISLVPEISTLRIVNVPQMKKTIKASIRIAMIIGMPASVGLVFMSHGIMTLLYPSQIEIIDSVSRILKVLGWGVVFLSLFQISTGILQGLDRQDLPAKNLFVGAVIKVVLSYILIGIPAINVLGAAFSTVCAYAIAALLNLKAIFKYSDIKPEYNKMFIKPMLVAFIMGGLVLIASMLTKQVMSYRLSTVLSVIFGIVSYLLLLIKFKVIDEDDLDLIPYGEKLSGLMQRIS